MYPSDLFQTFVIKIVGNELDWFFKRFLADHYERRRHFLQEDRQDLDLIPAIDHILKTCIDTSSTYPPESVSYWHECFLKLGSGHSHVFQQLFVIYLKSDVSSYLTMRERESTIGKSTRAKDRSELAVLEATLKRLNELPKMFDFTNSVSKLSTGLWALDNDQVGLVVNCLSDPAINLPDYFESTRELVQLIVGTLNKCGNARMALFMRRIHQYDHCDQDDYDQLYAFLLLASGQLVEALKYERLFAAHENYTEILQQFFELCSKLEITKALNYLNLSIEEEEILNQHMIIESSRPATPASCMNQTTRRVTISEAAGNTTGSSTPARHKSSGGHTPRNRSVQQLRKMPSFSDSPAKNTRLARKKKVVH